MTDATPARLATPAQVRRAAVLAASLGLHAVFLSWLAVSALGISGADHLRDDPFYGAIPLEMEPRPMLVGETVRKRPVAARPNDAPSARRPSPPVPRIAAAPPQDAPAPPADRPPAADPSLRDPWRVQAEDSQPAIGQALRNSSVGCRTMAGRLSNADQARCDQQLGAAASRAGPPGPRTMTAAEARREAGFARDGARALAQYESRRAPLNSGVGVVGPADCIGSNFGTGCAGAHLDPTLRQGATSNIRQGGNSPDLMKPIPGNE